MQPGCSGHWVDELLLRLGGGLSLRCMSAGTDIDVGSLTVRELLRLSASGPRAYFTGFNPTISGKAKKAKGQQIRDWHLNRRSSADLSGLAEEINPQVRGWITVTSGPESGGG